MSKRTARAAVARRTIVEMKVISCILVNCDVMKKGEDIEAEYSLRFV